MAVRAPATRDQADAYRFGLRRLEAALVRGDPVPLHEHIRTQRRAALAGALLGLLGLCAVAGYAVMVPRPDWRGEDVVVGAGSGAMYAVVHHPDRLVPVTNLVAARLVLAASRAGGAGDTGPAVPVSVPDDLLAAAPRTPIAAVPGALTVDPGQTVAPRWAVCDVLGPDGRIATTTAIGGAAPHPPAPPGDGALVVDPDGVGWLVVAGRRHRLDLGDRPLLAAYGLVGAAPRAVSGAILALLPEGPPMRTPAVPGRGRPGPRGVPGRIGDVLVVRPVGGTGQHVVVLAGGLQPVPEPVAELLRATSVARVVRPVVSDVLAAAPVVDELPVAGWPAAAPRLRGPEAAVLCWGWAADGPGEGSVWWGGGLPVPAGAVPVPLAQADGAGPRLDAAAVGNGGAVRVPRSDAAWLVSASGVGYPVLDAATAAAVGIGVAEPAPEAVLRLLPGGPPVDLRGAGRVLDLLPATR